MHDDPVLRLSDLLGLLEGLELALWRGRNNAIRVEIAILPCWWCCHIYEFH
jgi:hypothetical protein